MPRKQRFKPSRKPKPVDQNQEQNGQPVSHPRDAGGPEAEPTRPYGVDRHDDIESGRAQRTQADTSSVVETTGNTDQRA